MVKLIVNQQKAKKKYCKTFEQNPTGFKEAHFIHFKL